MESHLEQRTECWKIWRKSHLGSTDACVLMNGIHFGKTVLDLYNEKVNPQVTLTDSNFAMRRGVELEPLALAKFEEETGHLMTPRVLTHWNGVYPFLSASLDGYELEGRCAVEIKCSGKEDHALALKGIVPEKYIPQLQHIMVVTGLERMYYMSYVSHDDFTIFIVKRDNDYIDKLVKAELEFWQRVQDRNPPEPSDRDSTEITSKEWEDLSNQYAIANESARLCKEKLDEYELVKDIIKDQLLSLSNNRSAHGSGIKLSKSVRRGHIDYARVPQLEGLDLEQYRKPSTESWKITFNGEIDV